jgi:hypothetical protein
MKVDIILAYLGYSCFPVLKPLVAIASLIKETSRRAPSLCDSAYYINNATLLSGNDDVDHIVACRPVARQRLRNNQLYNSHF